MAQPPLHLFIGNYNTSSWSLRAWLVLRLARLAFIEARIPLRMPDTQGRIADVSPSGKLPVLLAEGVPIWDSLAIAEFVAELEPGIWPLDPIARAEARSVSAEMHSGFADLRRLMPMDVVGRFSPPGRLPRGLAADIDRINAIWGHCRSRFAPHGPFLFGAFSIADCMMAPVATRFLTHGVPLDGVVEDYVDSVMSWPDMVTWCDAAAAEQAERDAQGVLHVVAITRPGRVLGREAADQARVTTAASPLLALPIMAAATPPAPIGPFSAEFDPKADDDDAGREAEAVGSPLATPTAVAEPSTDTEPWPAAPSSELDSMRGKSGDDRDTVPAAIPGEAEIPRLIEAPYEPAPALVSPNQSTEADQPPPRRRLFESSTTPEAEPPAASVTAEEADGTSSPPDRPAPGVGPETTRAPAPKLGWIRRPVPVEHMQETEAPAADETIPAPRRQPATPAVKPIGGGILRRR